jgi:hypothetical protein
MRCSVAILFAFVLCIRAHAVLRDPLPFNTNPTTAAPCGVNAITDGMKSTPAATWYAGKPATIVWNLVASDGGGPVHAKFDPSGGVDFTVDAWTVDLETSGSNKIYNKTFIVPADLNCDASPTKLCTFRVYSSSNWNSCTMVKICSTDCDAPPSPPKICTKVTSPLTFCLNTTAASLSEGYGPKDIDQELSAIYTMNLGNKNVFSTPTNKDCPALYKDLLCGINLPPCDAPSGTVACKSQCQKAMKACGLTELHKDLYNCDALPNCNGAASKDGGSGGGMSPGGAAALSIFIIALVATIAVLGFIYYKKGQLFGYAYDKDLNKIVKVQSNPHNYTAYEDADYKI